jgi:hypothetical protein
MQQDPPQLNLVSLAEAVVAATSELAVRPRASTRGLIRGGMPVARRRANDRRTLWDQVRPRGGTVRRRAVPTPVRAAVDVCRRHTRVASLHTLCKAGRNQRVAKLCRVALRLGTPGPEERHASTSGHWICSCSCHRARPVCHPDPTRAGYQSSAVESAGRCRHRSPLHVSRRRLLVHELFLTCL